MIDLRIFVELDGLPLILAQALHSDGSVKIEEWINSYDEAQAWLRTVLGPDDLMAIHTRPKLLSCCIKAEPSLQRRSAAILRAIPTPLRHEHNGVHDLGEAPTNVDLAKLFDDAVESLGYELRRKNT